MSLLAFPMGRHVDGLAFLPSTHIACTCAWCSSKKVATSTGCMGLPWPPTKPSSMRDGSEARTTDQTPQRIPQLLLGILCAVWQAGLRTHPSLSKGHVFPFRSGVDVGFDRIHFRFGWNFPSRVGRTALRQTNFRFDPRTVARGSGAHVPLAGARPVREGRTACMQDRPRT